MNKAERILLLYDGDPIGDAVARQLQQRGIPFRELPGSTRADEIVEAAHGSHAIIAVGDTSPAAQPCSALRRCLALGPWSSSSEVMST